VLPPALETCLVDYPIESSFLPLIMRLFIAQGYRWASTPRVVYSSQNRLWPGYFANCRGAFPSTMGRWRSTHFDKAWHELEAYRRVCASFLEGRPSLEVHRPLITVHGRRRASKTSPIRARLRPKSRMSRSKMSHMLCGVTEAKIWCSKTPGDFRPAVGIKARFPRIDIFCPSFEGAMREQGVIDAGADDAQSG